MKERAQAISELLGTDMSTAINMLLGKAIDQHEKTLNPAPKRPIASERKDRNAAFGYLRGKIHVPDDFNEPLDDFKEYMQ